MMMPRMNPFDPPRLLRMPISRVRCKTDMYIERHTTILSSTRQANHHHVKPAGDSAGQPLNRVFERYRLVIQLAQRSGNGIVRGMAGGYSSSAIGSARAAYRQAPGTTPSSSLGRFRGTAAPAATRRPTGMAFLQRVTARRERLTRTRPLPVGVLLLVV